MESSFIRLVLLTLGAACAFAFPLPAQEVEPPAVQPAAPSAPALFQRIVLLGASVTNGFYGAQPLGGPKTLEYRFANYVEAALIGTHEPVATRASSLLFLNPVAIMERQVTAALVCQPTLVIGLDALFWFCYGAHLTAEQRLARFESGLRLLERFDVPLVIGDIPDASKAVGGMLAKAQVPEVSTIAQCNERLRKWAAVRGKVTVFPLARIMASAVLNEQLTLGDLRWEKGKSRALIQRDALHPGRHGLAALAVAVLKSAAASAAPSLPAPSVCPDLDRVYKAGVARGEALAAAQEQARRAGREGVPPAAPGVSPGAFGNDSGETPESAGGTPTLPGILP